MEEKTATLNERIEKIEERFPSSATLDKVASVNDAILATTVEELAKSIKRIEDKMINQWDVAKVVFQIITILIVIAGLDFTVITYWKPGT